MGDPVTQQAVKMAMEMRKAKQSGNKGAVITDIPAIKEAKASNADITSGDRGQRIGLALAGGMKGGGMKQSAQMEPMESSQPMGDTSSTGRAMPAPMSQQGAQAEEPLQVKGFDQYYQEGLAQWQ